MNSEPQPLPDLAAFQAALLQALYAGGEPTAMRAQLLARATTAELAAYIEQFDDRMLIVASELVQKWGQRR